MSDPTAPKPRASLWSRLARRAGRAVQPLLVPDADGSRAREEQLLTLIREQRTALRDLTDQSAVLLRRTEAIRSTDMESINARLAKLRGGVRRHSLALGRLADRVGADAELNSAEHRVVERLERISRAKGPVVVGPWTGEVGFELLYWIPFVRWAVQKYGIAPERIVVMSRGGTASWYEGIGGRYRDAFSLVTPEEFREGTERITRKQRFVNAFDRALLRRVRAELGPGTSVLHPALMYLLFTPIWKGKAPISRVFEHAVYGRIGNTAVPPALSLPSEYVAVRFYFSSCFPETPANRAFVAATVDALAEHVDVVMLNPGIRVDDHVDFSTAPRSRIHHVAHLMSARDNLSVQTAIIAGAKAFVGTYGGFAYLAPMCGVDAIAFYSERTWFLHHLELVEQVLADMNGGRFQAIDTGYAGWLRHVFGGGAANAGPQGA
jgi:hypothetical protein